MSEATSSTQTETKVHEAPDPVTKTEKNATAQNATDPAKPSLSTSEDMPPSSPKAQIAKNQDGNVASAANDVGGTTPAKVYSPPKYSETTEKEIRTMMNNARGVKDNNPFTADGDVAKLAMFTTNLVQLLNAEYIAKDVIVRAVAYMQGEDHLSPYRALSQAQRDRRAARRNTNSGQLPRNLADRGSKPRTTSDATKLPLDDVKNESAIVDGHHSSDIDTKTIASPSNASSNADSAGHGNGSDKENVTAKNSGSHANKPKKKGYWKARREARKKHADGNAHKDGAEDVATKLEDQTSVEIGEEQATEDTPGKSRQASGDGGVPVQA